MKHFFILLFAIVITGMTSACSHNKKKSARNKSHDRSSSLTFSRKVSFISEKGDTVSTIKAAIADDEKERNEGLMDVHSLAQTHGMLFLFEKAKQRSFWMANTPLSLDIIFISADKKIVRIHHSTKPFSEKNLPSGKDAKYVVETNGGYCVAHDIQEGMTVSM